MSKSRFLIFEIGNLLFVFLEISFYFFDSWLNNSCRYSAIFYCYFDTFFDWRVVNFFKHTRSSRSFWTYIVVVLDQTAKKYFQSLSSPISFFENIILIRTSLCILVSIQCVLQSTKVGYFHTHTQCNAFVMLW